VSERERRKREKISIIYLMKTNNHKKVKRENSLLFSFTPNSLSISILSLKAKRLKAAKNGKGRQILFKRKGGVFIFTKVLMKNT
jgi:hypothetical protein